MTWGTAALADLLLEAPAGYWGTEAGAADSVVHVIRNGDVKDSGVRWGDLPRRGFSSVEVARSAVRKADLLLTTSGDCGRVAMVTAQPEQATCASNFIRILRFDEDRVEPRFMFFALRSPLFQAQLQPFIRGTTLKNLSTKPAFASARVPMPPVQEQRRIAGILDRADALRYKRREALALLDTLGQSIFLERFGDLRENPRGWAVASVSDVAERVTDGEHKTPRRVKSGIPLLSARNVRDGWIDFANVDYIDAVEYANLSRRISPATGDILISCSGTIGRVAQVREQTHFSMVRSAALVRPNERVHPTFLESLLASRTLQLVMQTQANSSAQANLFQNQIKRLPVFVPPMARQIDFAATVERIISHRAAVHAAASADGQLFGSLQQRAFAGQL